ncbi:putative nucleolar complex protein [Hamiltosporidium magnivora]|uniref:Putative nucleolar complex protein n=1 Tax=Hamiltosporidium magnivora TaxID=148818 RepID=A0A4Q9LEB5_9MICR|nr:putative nucleolar complex protein [Hamiltosporidium magnivora]
MSDDSNLTVLNNLSEDCKKIIHEPEKNILLVTHILNCSTEYLLPFKNDNDIKNIINLSLLKVFKHIIPLYKIRTSNEKVKLNKEQKNIMEYDKKLLNVYIFYLKSVFCKNTFESYKCACEILNELDHFNFLEKSVNKVLIGTISEHEEIKEMCLDSVKNKLEGNNEETIFVIINQMYNLKFSSSGFEFLLNIKYLEDKIFSDLQLEENGKKDIKIEKKNKKMEFLQRKNEKKKTNEIFLKNLENNKNKMSICDKKREKSRRLNERIIDEVENSENIDSKRKTLKKIVDALLRLYFRVLYDKKTNFYLLTFDGLIKYKRFISQSFLEGLFLMLNNLEIQNNSKLEINKLLCIQNIFENRNYDFKKSVSIIYKILKPLEMDIDRNNLEKLKIIVINLFINMKQPINRVNAILHRLIQFCLIKRVDLFHDLIFILKNNYSVNFSDFDQINANNYSEEDIDLVSEKAFFEFHTFLKVVNK